MGTELSLQDLEFKIEWDDLVEIRTLAKSGIAKLKTDISNRINSVSGIDFYTILQGFADEVFTNTFWENVVESIDDLYRSHGLDAPDEWDEILSSLEDISEHADFYPKGPEMVLLWVPLQLLPVLEDLTEPEFVYLLPITSSAHNIAVFTSTEEDNQRLRCILDASYFRICDMGNRLHNHNPEILTTPQRLPDTLNVQTSEFNITIRPRKLSGFTGLYHVSISRIALPESGEWHSLGQGAFTFDDVIEFINSLD